MLSSFIEIAFARDYLFAKIQNKSGTFKYLVLKIFKCINLYFK